MNTAELNDLELEIDALIQNLKQLKADNQTLRDQLASSTKKCLRLEEKNQQAANKIRNIISQLKEKIA